MTPTLCARSGDSKWIEYIFMWGKRGNTNTSQVLVYKKPQRTNLFLMIPKRIYSNSSWKHRSTPLTSKNQQNSENNVMPLPDQNQQIPNINIFPLQQNNWRGSRLTNIGLRLFQIMLNQGYKKIYICLCLIRIPKDYNVPLSTMKDKTKNERK